MVNYMLCILLVVAGFAFGCQFAHLKILKYVNKYVKNENEVLNIVTGMNKKVERLAVRVGKLESDR